MHLLTIVQLCLIGLGLIFQIIALSWLFRDSSGEHDNGGHDEWHETKVNLGRRSRSAGRSLPRDSVHDYYEMEKTPHGVRPADLRKTARVKYVDSTHIVPPH